MYIIQVTVAQDDDLLEYSIALTTIPESITKTSEELWILSNKLIKFVSREMDFDEVNFRVLRSSVKELIAGTKCEMPIEFKEELKRIQRRHIF